MPSMLSHLLDILDGDGMFRLLLEEIVLESESLGNDDSVQAKKFAKVIAGILVEVDAVDSRRTRGRAGSSWFAITDRFGRRRPNQ